MRTLSPVVCPSTCFEGQPRDQIPFEVARPNIYRSQLLYVWKSCFGGTSLWVANWVVKL